MNYRVLISCRQLQETISPYREIFEQYNISIDLPTIEQQLSETDLLEIIDRYDGVIAGDDMITGAVIKKGARLKVIAKWGVGVDNIDLSTAEELGIPVVNTPAIFANEVSDATMGYILLLARGLHLIDRSVRAGSWLKIRGITLAGKKIGVIGLGSIGQAVIRRATAHGMIPLGFDIGPEQPKFNRQTGLTRLDLSSLLSAADFIVLCCNLTAENRHMLNEGAFAKMKNGVNIVNVARGPLIDENALITALESGKVGGAALDVFEEEPLSADSRLHEFDQCILGSHNSSNTVEGVQRTNLQAISNLLTGLGIGHNLSV